MTDLHTLKTLDQLTGNHRKWADQWLKSVETHDLPEGFTVGDRVLVSTGEDSVGEAEVLGATTGANGERWLMLWGLTAVVDQYPCWMAEVSDVVGAA